MSGSANEKTMQIEFPDGPRTLQLSGHEVVPTVFFTEGQASSLSSLAVLWPDLAGAAPADLANLCLHFHGRAQYLLIDDPQAFCQRYKAQCDYQPSIDSDPVTAADFPQYDTGEITLPVRSDTSLVFYVETTMHGLPYRVQLAWPPSGASETVHFTLLEMVDDPLPET